MTYANANTAFDAMDIAHKERVIRTFELIFGETGFANVRDAFSAAVEDECKAIETEMMLERLRMQALAVTQ